MANQFELKFAESIFYPEIYRLKLGNVKFDSSSFLLLVSFSVFADKFPNDVRWVRNSQEYEIICTQIFRDAKLSVEEHAKSVKLQEPNSVNKRFAVVVDLDETILDNSLYQIERWKAVLSLLRNPAEVGESKEVGLVPVQRTFLIL